MVGLFSIQNDVPCRQLAAGATESRVDSSSEISAEIIKLPFAIRVLPGNINLFNESVDILNLALVCVNRISLTNRDLLLFAVWNLEVMLLS